MSGILKPAKLADRFGGDITRFRPFESMVWSYLRGQDAVSKGKYVFYLLTLDNTTKFTVEVDIEDLTKVSILKAVQGCKREGDFSQIIPMCIHEPKMKMVVIDPSKTDKTFDVLWMCRCKLPYGNYVADVKFVDEDRILRNLVTSVENNDVYYPEATQVLQNSLIVEDADMEFNEMNFYSVNRPFMFGFFHKGVFYGPGFRGGNVEQILNCKLSNSKEFNLNGYVYICNPYANVVLTESESKPFDIKSKLLLQHSDLMLSNTEYGVFNWMPGQKSVIWNENKQKWYAISAKTTAALYIFSMLNAYVNRENSFGNLVIDVDKISKAKVHKVKGRYSTENIYGTMLSLFSDTTKKVCWFDKSPYDDSQRIVFAQCQYDDESQLITIPEMEILVDQVESAKDLVKELSFLKRLHVSDKVVSITTVLGHVENVYAEPFNLKDSSKEKVPTIRSSAKNSDELMRSEGSSACMIHGLAFIAAQQLQRDDDDFVELGSCYIKHMFDLLADDSAITSDDSGPKRHEVQLKRTLNFAHYFQDDLVASTNTVYSMGLSVTALEKLQDGFFMVHTRVPNEHFFVVYVNAATKRVYKVYDSVNPLNYLGLEPECEATFIGDYKDGSEFFKLNLLQGYATCESSFILGDGSLFKSTPVENI